MTDVTAPGGLTESGFKAMASSVGSWLWGTAQGAFNEKASMSQIITDAVIGMIPVVGDVTAVRDLFAISIGLVDEPKKRDDVWQWVFLVVLIFALIPVIGGVIKGVGRLIIKAVGEAARIAGQAERVAHMGMAAKDIIAFLNRVGVGNAEKWLLKLNFAEHQAAIIEKFNGFAATIDRSLTTIQKRMHAVLPDRLLARIEALKTGFAALVKKADEMVPKAIKELDQKLKEIQQFIHSGGETTSRTVQHTVATGDKAAATYVDELRLLEEGSGALRSARGGWVQNAARVGPKDADAVKKIYHAEAGFPDLLKRVERSKSGDDTYTFITTYAGKIANRKLHDGEQLFRVFGPEGLTHAVEVSKSYPTGPGLKFWGVGAAPKSGREWRETAAVLDEWNHDTFIISGRVTEHAAVNACTGKIAEQFGKDLSQYLPGGAQQAVFEMSADAIKKISAAATEAMASKGVVSVVADGIEFTIRPTGWKDVNGVWGYLHMPGPATVQTARLGSRELASKDPHGAPAGATAQ